MRLTDSVVGFDRAMGATRVPAPLGRARLSAWRALICVRRVPVMCRRYDASDAGMCAGAIIAAGAVGAGIGLPIMARTRAHRPFMKVEPPGWSVFVSCFCIVCRALVRFAKSVLGGLVLSPGAFAFLYVDVHHGRVFGYERVCAALLCVHSSVS